MSAQYRAAISTLQEGFDRLRAFCVQTNEPPEFWLVTEVVRELKRERESLPCDECPWEYGCDAFCAKRGGEK